MRRCGELSNGQRLIEIALSITQYTLDTVGFGFQLRHSRKLRLATGTLVIDHPLPDDGPGHIHPEILLDHRQHEVDPGSHPGRRPHRAVDDEDAVFLHLNFWEPSP